ncbi:uncharacterized protein RJT21DRAFT_117496, partial [Scheffersomyces amazonensis]|uniref:uncharacterized protein n=1 Tax=Scheffersomyces amazonensis TaxID=1078765 RepID=UPI00315D696B
MSQPGFEPISSNTSSSTSDTSYSNDKINQGLYPKTSLGSTPAVIPQFASSTSWNNTSIPRTPITPTQSSRLPQMANPITPIDSSEMFSKNKLIKSPTPNHSQNHNHSHRHSSSVSSILSTTSVGNVNLATLKKQLNLKPGEGERSNYVSMIRKTAGTAFNETGPGKWKLPVGIMPVDKSNYLYSNRYMRRDGFTKNKKGVELRHGKLERPLLADEIDNTMDISNGVDPVRSSLSKSGSIKLSDSSVVVSSNASVDYGLQRISTDNSIDQSSSGSPGNTSDNGFGFYQHKGYRDDEETDDDNSTEVDPVEYGFGVDSEDRPRLTVANPDD